MGRGRQQVELYRTSTVTGCSLPGCRVSNLLLFYETFKTRQGTAPRACCYLQCGFFICMLEKRGDLFLNGEK